MAGIIGGVLLAPASAHAVTYANSTTITIPTQGSAAVSTLTPGVEPGAFIVGRVRVVLYGYYHGRPRDVDAYVVGPNGRAVMVMSDGGGDAAISYSNRRTWGFADDATSPLIQNGAPGSATLKPTDYEPGDGPAGYTTVLANFNGAPVEGAWKLFVNDDSANSGGAIANGWGLDITLVNRPEPDGDSDPIGCEDGVDCPSVEPTDQPALIKPGGSLTLSSLLSAGGIRVKVKVKKKGSTVSGVLVKRPKKGRKSKKKPFVFAKGKAKKVPKGTYTLLLKPTKKGKSKLTSGLKSATKLKLAARLKVDPPGKGKVATKTVKLTVKR